MLTFGVPVRRGPRSLACSRFGSRRDLGAAEGARQEPRDDAIDRGWDAAREGEEGVNCETGDDAGAIAFERGQGNRCAAGRGDLECARQASTGEVAEMLLELGRHGTRANERHMDASTREIRAKRFGKAGHEEFGPDIGREGRQKREPETRTDVQDAAAPASDHGWYERAGQGDEARHVQLDHRLEALGRGEIEQAHVADARIVDEHVDLDVLALEVRDQIMWSRC